ncbi:hypothetical protein J3F83DRAFT_426821 [Trichoderma novae-zelandiae]
MFSPRIRSRLLERYQGQLFRRVAVGSGAGSGSGVQHMVMRRGYATGKGSLDKAPVNVSPSSPSPSARITATTTTPSTSSTASSTSTGPSKTGAAGGHQQQQDAAAAAALRTAEQRESALRAARLRRLAQHQDRLAEEAKAREARRAYKRRYDGAARKWVSTIIALPILLVTSYYLFDRLVLGRQPKSLEKYRGERGD